MTVQLRLCRSHGGVKRRGRPPKNCRCVACDMERRALRRKKEDVRVSYELQADVGHLAGVSDWYLSLRSYDRQEEAQGEMERVLQEFHSARMRVIKVISEEASDGVQATN